MLTFCICVCMRACMCVCLRVCFKTLSHYVTLIDLELTEICLSFVTGVLGLKVCAITFISFHIHFICLSVLV